MSLKIFLGRPEFYSALTLPKDKYVGSIQHLRKAYLYCGQHGHFLHSGHFLHCLGICKLIDIGLSKRVVLSSTRYLNPIGKFCLVSMLVTLHTNENFTIEELF